MNGTLLRTGLCAALLSVAVEAHAIELAKPIRETNHWGIGFGGGIGTSGISFKWFIQKAFALQGIVGAYPGQTGWGNDPFGSTGLGIQVDFLFELPTIVMAGDVMELGWCVGPGIWMGIGPDFWLGVNGTIGLEFNFIPVPIDLVLEYKPALRIVDSVGFNPATFGGHVRIYFM